jgi:hypothetical protein
VTNTAVSLQRGVWVDEAGEPRDQRDLTSGICAAEVEGAVVGLMPLCVLCDNRVPSEQSDEAEKEEDKTPDVRNATQSEDGAAPVILLGCQSSSRSQS